MPQKNSDQFEQAARPKDIDLSLLFAKAEVAVKEYLIETNGGYDILKAIKQQ